jgi:hypothetical protein
VAFGTRGVELGFGQAVALAVGTPKLVPAAQPGSCGSYLKSCVLVPMDPGKRTPPQRQQAGTCRVAGNETRAFAWSLSVVWLEQRIRRWPLSGVL